MTDGSAEHSGQAGSGRAAAFSSRRLVAAAPHRRAWLFIPLLVLAGAVIGSGATIVYFKSEMYRRPPRPHDLGRVIVERLDSVVGLTDSERTVLVTQIDRLMEEVEAVRAASFAEIQTKFDASNAKLRVILGEERYQLWEKYKDENLPKRRGRRGLSDDSK